MKLRASSVISLGLTLLALTGLLIFPEAASGGARAGLALCGAVIVPSLFPFSVLSGMLLELKFPYILGKITAPFMRRFFRVSGRGTAAFFLGITGGYPLGAGTVSEMYAAGQLDRDEAVSLLGFCNNSGPAFIISFTGAAVFGSLSAGFYLYGVHIAAAVLTGVLMRGKKAPQTSSEAEPDAAEFAHAFSVSITRAANSSIMVCGFVVFFSVVMSLLDSSGILPSLCGRISAQLGLELHFTRSLLSGIFELGTGIGSMMGLSKNGLNLALAAFILGWGGLSVHAQAIAVIKESGLPVGRHFLGKLLHGGLSALIAFFAYPVFF